MNGIQFNKLSLRNFLSFGSQPTTINLTGNHITVVLGLNHDTGGDESRNGAGKSAIIDALSYSLYGKTIRDVSNAKLVNKMARKGQGMLVVLEMDTPSGSYRIERGEAPSKLKLYKKDLDNTDDFLTRDGKTYIYDISRNKNETTAEIEGIIGFDIKLFEFLIANSSESVPFMKLTESKKREIAERLMGLNLLTERADELKETRKTRKTELVSMESAQMATEQANQRITRQIDDLKNKERQWDIQRDHDMSAITKQIEKLSGVDVDEQIEILELLATIETEDKRISSERRAATMELSKAKRDLSDINREVQASVSNEARLMDDKEQLDKSVCPTCSQHWVPDETVIDRLQDQLAEITKFLFDSKSTIIDAETNITAVQEKLSGIDDEGKELSDTIDGVGDFKLVFDSVREANEASIIIGSNNDKLTNLENAINPHTDTINNLGSDAVHKIDKSDVVELRKLINHYNYLIELLQAKDSFLRKAVIDRWLPKLNGRIAKHLDTLELSYKVRLTNELGMEITDFNEAFDWGNLSKGQRQRVTIALNLAFQDLFEATNHPLSLLMVDELVDAGICARGASKALQAYQETCDAKNKRVFLITHRMDIADAVSDTMVVELKNRISTIVEDEE